MDFNDSNANHPELNPARSEPPLAWTTRVAALQADTVVQRFEKIAAESPEAPAVVMAERQLSYRELNARANQLAHFLRQRQVGPDTPVAICTERSIEMVIGQLAILKAGGAYVPLDASYPMDRLTMMLDDTEAPVLLTQRHLRDALPVRSKTEIICLDDAWAHMETLSIENPVANVTGENLAYIIYTSGSTGRPKGVSVPHRGILRLVLGQDYAPFGPQQRFLLLASPSFDGIIFELWGALLHGGCCVIFPDRWPEFSKLEQVIREQRVSCLWLTSGLFNQIIDHRPQTLASAGSVLIGGEALSASHVQRAMEILPHLALINGYGPTECTTFACAYRIGPMNTWLSSSVPIGPPINNTECHIVDETLAPVAINEPGELLLGGIGLARGYFRRPELTAEKFIPNPFSDDPDARLYRTSDRCRWLPNGLIEYLGRIDDQIKLRGYRIEPGEIEVAMRKLPGVLNGAVLTRDLGAGKQLVSCVVAEAGQELLPSVLRSQLAALLPDYMVPVIIHLVDELPLTGNGKVDRRALATRFAIEAAPPHSPSPDASESVETTLLALWRNILHHPSLGPHDSFFDHGGDSLLCLQLTLEIERILGRSIPVGTVYDSPSPAAFASQWTNLREGMVHPVLRGSGPDTPLFHIPGFTGVEKIHPALAGLFSERRPYYDDLVYAGCGDERMPSERVEEIAAEMVRQIRGVQATGPYCLSGFSFGGLVAYETARQLKAAGENVETVVLWDAVLAHLVMRKNHLQIFQSLLKRLAQRCSSALTHGNINVFFRKSEDFAKIIWFLDKTLPRVLVGNWLERHIPRYDEVSAACFRAYDRYRPEPYTGDVLLFRCTDLDMGILKRIQNLPDLDWGRFVRGALTTHHIDCRHEDLIIEPHASRVMALTREGLSR